MGLEVCCTLGMLTESQAQQVTHDTTSQSNFTIFEYLNALFHAKSLF